MGSARTMGVLASAILAVLIQAGGCAPSIITEAGGSTTGPGSPDAGAPIDVVMVTVGDPLHSGSVVTAGTTSCADVSPFGDGTGCAFAAGPVTLTAAPHSGYGVSWGGACAQSGTGTTCTVGGGSLVSVTFWPTGSSVWWVATTGKDSSSGRTPQTAFATFHKALTTMAPGDTLYIDDGTYHQSIGGYEGPYTPWDTSICAKLSGVPPCLANRLTERQEGPNGTDAAHRTRILGFRRHKAIIDGTQASGENGIGLQIFEGAHVEVGNLSFVHTTIGDPVHIEQSDDIYLHQVAAGYSDPENTSDNNRNAFYIGDSSNVLVEESWAWGFGARYGVIFHAGTHNIARRNVVRYDGSYDGQARAGVALYSEDQSIAENNIVVDFDSGPDDTNRDGHAPFFATCSVPLSSPSLSAGLGTISWFGNIAVAATGDFNGVMQLDSYCSTGGTITVADNVLARAPGSSGSGEVGLWLQMDNDTRHTAVLSHNTIYGVNGTGMRFDDLPSWTSIAMVDNLVDGATAMCVQDLASERTRADYNQLYGCQGLSLAGDAHLVTASPSLAYLVRVDGGPGKGTASDGGDRGATVVKRYESGELTSGDLWPFPNEDLIRADFCAGPDNGKSIITRGHNASGWCASGKSLTQYVWEQLGQPSPY